MTMQAKQPPLFNRPDPQKAFALAIANGHLTEASAGDYMYMYSKATADGHVIDNFKHRDTREYLEARAT